MPEFFGRPSLNVPASLWQQAIQSAAEMSNPMLKNIQAGMDMFGKGLGAMAESKSALSLEERKASNAKSLSAEEFGRKRGADAEDFKLKQGAEADAQYKKTIAELMGKGRKFTPVGDVVPEGAMTTHMLAQVLQVEPKGPNMVIEPDSTFENKRKLLAESKSGKKDKDLDDLAMKDAMAFIKQKPGYISSTLPDDEQKRKMAELKEYFKSIRNGTYVPPPPQAAAPEKPGILSRIAGTIMGTGSANAAPATPAKSGDKTAENARRKKLGLPPL